MRTQLRGSGCAGSSPPPNFDDLISHFPRTGDCSSPHHWPGSATISQSPLATWRWVLVCVRWKERHAPAQPRSLSTWGNWGPETASNLLKITEEKSAESGLTSKAFGSLDSTLVLLSHCLKPWRSFRSRKQPRWYTLASVSTKSTCWSTLPVISVLKPFLLLPELFSISN